MANEYRVSQFAAEVVLTVAADARVSQFAIEVVRTVTGTTTATRRRQIVNG